jgi:DNA-binding transcriptional LysR family regulator
MTPYDPMRSFIEVIRTGTVSAAAGRLGITQPAVSGHIRVLEAQLGHALFERVSRGMVPTRLAQDMARQIAGPLDQLDTAFAGLRARSKQVGGTVRIVAPAPFARARLLPAIGALEAAGLTVDLQFGGQDVIYDRLLSGAVDMAITASQPTSAELGWCKVAVERLVAVASPGWVDVALHGHATLAAARMHPPIAYDADLPLIREVLMLSELDAVLPRPDLPEPSLIAGDLHMLRDLALAGRGWTVLPDYMIAVDLARGDLCCLDMPGANPKNVLNLAWLKVALRTPRVALAKAVLVEALTTRT